MYQVSSVLRTEKIGTRNAHKYLLASAVENVRMLMKKYMGLAWPIANVSA